MGALCVAIIMALAATAAADRVDWSQYLEPPSARAPKAKTATKQQATKTVRPAKAPAKKVAPRTAKARPRRK